MEFDSDKLDEIESVTVEHYDTSAESFWAGTRNHDVTQNYHAMLSQFPAGQTLDILDLGCGPGRDILYFKKLGHRPVGLDGSHEFCKMARTYTGCEVIQQTFLNMSLSREAYDGIFANASLFHVPSQEFHRILIELYDSLRPGGILFSSNPRGNSEGWDGNRYGYYCQFDSAARYLEEAGFEVLHHYYRHAGKPIEEQPWLAIISRRKP